MKAQPDEVRILWNDVRDLKHIYINDSDEFLAFKLTPDNTYDRKYIPELRKYLISQLWRDRECIAQKISKKLYQQGLQLITYLQ